MVGTVWTSQYYGSCDGGQQRHHLLRVYQGHERLHPGEGVGPGVAESHRAVFGQVVLSEEAIDTQHPGVLHRLGEDPHVRGAPDVVMTVDEQRVPLHQPLEVDVVASWQGGLRTSKWHRRVRGQGSQLD